MNISGHENSSIKLEYTILSRLHPIELRLKGKCIKPKRNINKPYNRESLLKGLKYAKNKLGWKFI